MRCNVVSKRRELKDCSGLWSKVADMELTVNEEITKVLPYRTLDFLRKFREEPHQRHRDDVPQRPAHESETTSIGSQLRDPELLDYPNKQFGKFEPSFLEERQMSCDVLRLERVKFSGRKGRGSGVRPPIERQNAHVVVFRERKKLLENSCIVESKPLEKITRSSEGSRLWKVFPWMHTSVT